MNKLLKKILFFILAPIYGTLGLFMHLTYPWWQSLYKGNYFKKIIFCIFFPIYAPIAFLLANEFIGYEWWAGLGTVK
jgi:hypothetical protein